MKDVIKVSIAGVAFTFGEDAFRVVDDYLKKLEAGYARHPDGREIVADIEARMAELILEHQESDRVITRELAEEIVRQLGYPDDMSPEDEQAAGKFPRRLYRNPDGAVLGGICSGLASYFKTDPVWIRLAVFLPLLLSIIFHNYGSGEFFISVFGIMVLLYFVLWIAVPMARTPRQKLEMRGERVTADSIRQEFEQEAEARRPENRTRSRKNASVWADIVYTIGRILLFMIKMILFFIALIVGVVLLSILIAIVAVIFGLNIAAGGVMMLALDGMVGIGPAGFAAIWLLVLFIPLFLLFYWMLKALFGKRSNRSFVITAWVIWLILLIWGAALTVRNADIIRYGVEDFIERVENDGFETYWDEYLDDYIIDADSGTQRIRRVDGGPVTIERSNGPDLIISTPDDWPDDWSDGVGNCEPQITGDGEVVGQSESLGI